MERESRPPMPPSPDLRATTGLILALVSSVLFAFNMTLARLSYAWGADAFTLNLTRVSRFAGILLAILVLSGRPIRPASGQALPRAGLGVLLSLQVLCILAAIETIPVGLAILVYYLYPFGIALILAAFERHRLPRASVLAMLVAFGGLALALGPRMDALDGRGLALAAFAAAAFSVVFVWSGRIMAGTDHYTFVFHIMTAGATFLGITALARGEALAWPAEPAGWAAFLGSAAMFCLATLTMFLAIGRIGALRMSFIDFGSPVWTILLGFLILGEQLTTIQGAGAALVVGAIVAHQIAETRRR